MKIIIYEHAIYWTNLLLVLVTFSAIKTPTIGPDHIYSCNVEPEHSPEYKDQSCQTTLTGKDIDEMQKWKDPRYQDAFLRDTVVKIVTEDDNTNPSSHLQS